MWIAQRTHRHRGTPRLPLVVALSAVLLGGGVAGAAESGTHALVFQVQSGRSITVAADIVGDDVTIRQTDTVTGLTSSITGYVGASTTDVIQVSRTSAGGNPADSDGAVQIYVLASSLTCASCNAGAVPPETAGTVVEGTPGGPVDPVLVTAEGAVVISGINTGSATAGAALTYTVVTTKAPAGSYSYTLTYLIRAA